MPSTNHHTATSPSKRRLLASAKPVSKLMLTLIASLVVITGVYVVMRSLAATGDPQYPLKVSADNRYLVDQAGTPRFMAADTAWNMFSRLTTSEAAQYLDARKAQGFNTVMTSVFDISSGSISGTNRSGQSAFNGGNIGSPNANYFTTVDAMVNLAKDRGMQVVILPAWLSWAGKNGSYTTANASAYGSWLGNRYKSFDNIIWMVGGDWGGATEGTCPKQSETRALATAIKAADGRHLMTYHPGSGLASSTCYNGDSWLNINSNYWDFNYNNVSSAYRFMYRDYGISPTRPTIMIETGYEGPFPKDSSPNALNARTSRMQSYWMALSGAFGFTYGAQQTYEMVNGSSNATRTWQQTLSIPGGNQQGYIGRLFNGLNNWWKLVPDQNHSVLTAGYGSNGQADYVTAARAGDGSLIMAYLPTSRTVTVDMSKLSGAATGRWFDPTNNTFRSIGSGLANSGSRQFAAPGTNSAGDSDWVLILETGSSSSATPVPSTPTPTQAPSQGVYKVMPLGDSITEGMHNTVSSPDGGYRKVLSDRFGAKIDMVGSLSNNNVGVTDKEHEGHSGWRTDQINASISGWISTYKPDIVLLHIGTNDVLQGKSASEMTSNVDQIMAKIYAANSSTKVVLASMIPMWGQGSWTPAARTDFNAAVPGLVNKYKAQGRGAYLADMSTGGFISGGADFPDGVHPNLQGYTKIANVWEPVMKSIMGSGTAVTPTPTPVPTTPTPVLGGSGSVNNSAFSFSSGWQQASNAESYQGDDQYSSTTGATYSLTFTGTQAKIYTTKAPHHGIMAVRIDDGSETNVDLYAADRQAQQLVYTSLALTGGTHTLSVRVTGTKNAASTGTVVVADRIDVTAGTATPTPSTQAGDVNADGKVNISDLSLLLGHWGQNYAAADFNKDGTVSAVDLSILLGKWTG